MHDPNSLPASLRAALNRELRYIPMDLDQLERMERAIDFPQPERVHVPRVEVDPVPPVPRPPARRVRSRASAAKSSGSDDDGDGPSPFPASRSLPATAEGDEPSNAEGEEYPESESRKIPRHHTTHTLDLADRLQAAALKLDGARRARVLKQAQRLRECAERNTEGKRTHHRCHLPCCPSCQRQQAKLHNRRLCERLDESPADLLRFVRLSVVADLDHGVEGALRTITAALSKLRRRTVWSRNVSGGHAHVEPAAADPDSGQSWNVHAHLVLLLHDGRDLDPAELASAWTEVLVSLGCEGGCHVVEDVWL